MCEKEWKHFLSTEIFFFFYKSKKTFFSLENLPQIWGFVIVHLIFFYFFSGHKKRKKIWRILNISEDFFFFEAEWKKKIPLFFPLHALNWNFMFKMKWKKVSHKKKKTFSHFRKKKLLCRQKVMVMVFTHEKTIRLCDRIPGSALCVSTLWPLALLGSWVSGPWVVALGRGVTADSRVLLADAIVLASMPTPEKRRKISTRSL